MLFKESLAQKIVLGEKTQTRRPIKEGEQLFLVDVLATVKAKGRIKWQAGRDYAVQYGRGFPTRYFHPVERKMVTKDEYMGHIQAIGKSNFIELMARLEYIPLRIKVLDIWNEDVRYITHDDVIAEGFNSPIDFWTVWCGFYDAEALPRIRINGDLLAIQNSLATRPDDKYQAWAIEFEVLT